jgi:hypothetical protein
VLDYKPIEVENTTESMTRWNYTIIAGSAIVLFLYTIVQIILGFRYWQIAVDLGRVFRQSTSTFHNKTFISIAQVVLSLTSLIACTLFALA